MPIRAVLFDLDNTLTHRDQSIQRYSEVLLQQYQAYLAAPDLDKIQQIIRRIDNGGYPKKEELTHSSIGASVAHALQQELDWQAEVDFHDLTHFWFEHFGQCAVAMYGAVDLLVRLKQQGYALAVVSNGGHETRLNILRGLGFSAYFDVIVNSGLVGISKPHKDIFLHTAESLGVQVSECLFIGDHPVNDIRGAQQAGMQAIWLQGFHPEDTSLEVPRIQQLQELNIYLERL
ncbi:HAD family hydrolase [Acinetobacter zhairhuonensis]|uniref:HAD family hydrolase n=1 Tax=Acinetobacter sp. A7.4 TaxID=2919921 RepID=UPI001F5033EC|nr:HAD family hydrolase [Acinetobacter sp. A7.4]MCJ8162361.1 HAD family hydrolase [Acinetobacter sp. A7.4]